MAADAEGPTGFEVTLGDDDFDLWRDELDDAESHSLVDLVNRVLDRGVCISGDVTISVAGVDLVFLGVDALITSVSTARRLASKRGDHEGGGSSA